MRVLERISKAFQNSYENAEMIGQTRTVLWQLEAEMKELPEHFSCLTREQFLIYVQSRLQKNIPNLPMDKRVECLEEAERLYRYLKH
ncbi:MAG: hypothetical protein SCK29_05425 [Bacillota bacterium]|nr:hypothetical protein [Bacillota bacterium]MDW7683544.1 hypothetical protein [Bacillota bacterium]